MPLKQGKQMISNEKNMIENPNWNCVGFEEFGATEDKSIQWQGGGIEPGTSGLEVQRPNH